MSKKQPPITETVTVNNMMTTVPDTERAVDLFARILRAVREQIAEDNQQKQESGEQSAA
jgi:hypothetical protein